MLHARRNHLGQCKNSTGLKRTKRFCLHRKHNKTFIFVSMQGSFFSPYYSLKSKQSLVHLLRRCKEKDIIHRMSSCCPLSVLRLLPCRCSYLVANASSIITTLNSHFIYLYCISKTNNGLCNTGKYLLSDVLLSNK